MTNARSKIKSMIGLTLSGLGMGMLYEYCVIKSGLHHSMQLSQQRHQAMLDQKNQQAKEALERYKEEWKRTGTLS